MFLPVLIAVASCAQPVGQSRYDLLITGGSLLDGNGTPAVAADLGIRDGIIAEIGDLAAATAARRIDASGLSVAPGFIDIHNHSDYTILREPRAESMIRQGVTTMVLGESRSAGPVKPGVNDDPRAGSDGAALDWTTLGGYFDRLQRQRMSTNIASYVGHEQVWTYVKGYSQSPATADEIEGMKRLVAQAMEDGALGLSTSLLQPPSSVAATANLIDLAKVADQYGGIYSTHIRDEGENVLQSVREAIQVGREAGIPVDIIHMKIAHKKLWGRANEIVAMVQQARDAGVDIQANVYPYTAGQNNLASIVPPWAHEGGRQKMLERLADPVARRRMRAEVLNGLPDWYNHYLATGGGWGGMLLVALQHERNRPFQGRRMSELIQARGGHPADVLFDVLLEEEGSVPTVFFHHSEEDMQLIMQQPWTSIGSDGSAVSPDGPSGRSHPHPRYYGTFPRVLGRYVRELKVLTLPEAVRKMTSMNADKIGIRNRGRLEEGMAADITIFDHGRVIDRATFEDPHQFPAGIKYVIVNGEVTVDDGTHTGALAGRVLFGPGRRSSGAQEARSPKPNPAGGAPGGQEADGEPVLWTFDRLDRIGGHPTEVLGSPRIVDTPIGRAMEFDGVDDAVFLDTHPLAGAQTFTWEAIFRPDGGDREQRWFHLQETGSENRMLFEIRVAGDRWFLDSFNFSTSGTATLMNRDSLHPLGAWYHVAAVYDGKTFSNYVNGVRDGAREVQLSPQGPGRTSIGVRINLVNYFKGAIHSARFTRRALRPGEFRGVPAGARS